MGGKGEGAAALLGPAASAAMTGPAPSDDAVRRLGVFLGFFSPTALNVLPFWSRSVASFRDPWAVPGPMLAQQLGGGLRAPRALRVWMHGRRLIEQRLEDSPGL